MGARLKLTPKQKKRIIADHVDGISNVQIAKKFGVSETTIRRVLKSDPETAKLVEEKKEQDVLDIFAYMDSRKAKAQQIIDIAFDKLTDQEKWERSSPQAIATALGIIIDKYTGLAQMQQANGGQRNELLQSLFDLEKNNGD